MESRENTVRNVIVYFFLTKDYHGRLDKTFTKLLVQNVSQLLIQNRRRWRELEERENLDVEEHWFRQDGPPPQEFRERLNRKAESEWAPHSPDLNSTRFLPLGVAQRQHLPAQHLHHCCIEGSHHREDSSDHPVGMCTYYQ